MLDSATFRSHRAVLRKHRLKLWNKNQSLCLEFCLSECNGSGIHRIRTNLIRSISDMISVYLTPRMSFDSFNDLEIKQDILDALRPEQINDPTNIQQASLQPMLEGKIAIYPLISRTKKRPGSNVMITSATGSGKATSYCISCLQSIDLNNPNCQVLVLGCTRELAFNIFGVCVFAF